MGDDWKCPVCKRKFTGKNAYQRCQKHFYSVHYRKTSAGKPVKPKTRTFKPMTKRRK